MFCTFFWTLVAKTVWGYHGVTGIVLSLSVKIDLSTGFVSKHVNLNYDTLKSGRSTTWGCY